MKNFVIRLFAYSATARVHNLEGAITLGKIKRPLSCLALHIYQQSPFYNILILV